MYANIKMNETIASEYKRVFRKKKNGSVNFLNAYFYLNRLTPLLF